MTLRGVTLAGLLVTLVVGGVTALAADVARRRREPSSSLDVSLVIRNAPLADTTGASSTTTDEDRAMALAISSLTAAEREHVLDVVDAAADRLEARANPLLADFGDGDPIEQLELATAAYLPALSAARALDREDWVGAGLQVRIVRSCEGIALAPNETCVPAWSRLSAEPQVAERGRFVAWAVSGLGVLELPDDAAAAACASELRLRVPFAGSHLALVLRDADLALVPVEQRSALKAAARRLGAAMAANGLRESRQLDALARGEPAGRVAPWLALGPRALAVIPRLSAVGAGGRFAEEVEGAASCRGMRWLHRP